jgi:hypothetical protein
VTPDESFVYVITCEVVVDPGVTLTLAAGTVVQFTGPTIDVAGGSLVANGTSGSPVVFTSIRDDSVGGATQIGSPPGPGDWRGLVVQDATDGSAGGSSGAVVCADWNSPDFAES